MMLANDVGTPAGIGRSGIYGLCLWTVSTNVEACAGGGGCGVGTSTSVDICPGGCAEGDREAGPTMPLWRPCVPAIGDLRLLGTRFSRSGWYSWMVSVSAVIGAGRMMV